MQFTKLRLSGFKSFVEPTDFIIHPGLTGIVEVESLIAAMKQLVPAYRRQHVETNERALRAGADAAAPGLAPIAFQAA